MQRLYEGPIIQEKKMTRIIVVGAGPGGMFSKISNP